jgi:hypothetical protein
VTANVGDNLRFIVNYSYSFQERSNAYKHTYPKFQELDRLIADVQAAHPGVDVLGARGTAGETLAALLARNWEDLEGRKLDFGNAVGNRAHKANFFANYTFKRGRLNGWAVGFGGRYLGPNHAGRIYTAPGAPPSISGGNVGVGINGPEVYGNDSLQFDAMLRYAPRVGWLGRNGRWSLQLNVRNLADRPARNRTLEHGALLNRAGKHDRYTSGHWRRRRRDGTVQCIPPHSPAIPAAPLRACTLPFPVLSPAAPFCAAPVSRSRCRS